MSESILFFVIKNHIMKNQITIVRTLAIALVLLLSFATAQAQSVAGRVAFGIDGGLNKYYGNYTDNQFAFHGDAFIRWNILDYLSLHAAYNGGQLKYKASDASIANSGGGPVGSINHTRVGGWDLMASYNVFPEQTFVPYVIAGIEALNFEPNDANDVPLKNNAAAAYDKNVIGGVFGVGFEMYISDKVTFNGKVLLHLTGTDWVDDYSDPTNFRQDAFLTMGVGFSYYIFAPPTPVKESGPDHVTNVTNTYQTNIYNTDTVYVASPKDTVYLVRPKVNTIYNFPGTLFIVNTDQFNNSEPSNMNNLYYIKALVNQCPELKVEIQGHASDEGTVERNQELSEMRAKRIKSWLIEQGVNPTKISGTVGYGTSYNAVKEPTGGTAADLEAARVQNRRIGVRVVETCK
jgi:outer membrane protein OmpA-like peptidoglycan-associated protein